MAGDAGAAKIIEFLARHFDHRDDADIGLAGGELVGAFGGQGEAEIEGRAERCVG